MTAALRSSLPAEPAAPSAEALMQFLYQAPIGLVQCALDGSIAMINPKAAELLMPLAGPLGLLNLFEVLHAAAPALPAQARAAPWPGGSVCDDLRITLPAARSGEEGGPTVAVKLLRLEHDLLMASVSDVSAEVQREQQRMAATRRDASRTDALTRLPNRSVVLERIQAALDHAGSTQAPRLAVLFINADRFNQVNLSLGQAAGDDLLRHMAARLRHAVRRRDVVGQAAEPTQTAARLGVDEFVLVLEELASDEAAHWVAQRVVDALGKPYTLAGVPVHCSASVGVVVGGTGTGSAAALLQQASLAMREAKRSGGGRYRLFEPAMQLRATQRASLESELRLALAEGQLFVVFQPIVQLPQGRLQGVEALVRWRHPQRGLVPPGDFIGIAEDTGLIGALGAQVLQMACRQFAQWRQTLGDAAPPLLSVNLSRAQLLDPALPELVQQVLTDCALPAECLQLEITESLAAESPLIQSRLHQLKRLGLLLALDDFGTGYSSLANLHQWPVDVIKIDRSFVQQIEDSAHHRVLVEATVRVATSLQMQTVAEGVESAAQAGILAGLHCDKAQGYLYARPLAADDAQRFFLQRCTPNAPGSA